MRLKVQQHNAVISSPIGKLGVVVVVNKLVKIAFLPWQTPTFVTHNVVVQQTVEQLKEYFCHPGARFKIPLGVGGTPLQQKVWQTIQKIPCGKTVTYGELAQKIATGPRVVGNACRCNPIPLVIPCHRVVAATGIGGYCGNKDYLLIKRWLLNFEQSC